jgi:hypothetical protein
VAGRDELAPTGSLSPSVGGLPEGRLGNSETDAASTKQIADPISVAPTSVTDVIAPPPGELFSETNDNSVAILL